MRGHIKRVVERRAIRRRRRLRIPVAAVDKPHNLIRIFKRNVVVSRSTRLPIINEGTVRMRSLLQYRHYNTLFRNQLGLVFRYFYKRLLYDTSSYLFYRTILLAPNAFSWNKKWNKEDKHSYIGIYWTPRTNTTRFSGYAYKVLTHYKPVTNVLFRKRSTFDRIVRRYGRTGSIVGTARGFVNVLQIAKSLCSLSSTSYCRLNRSLRSLFGDVGRRVGEFTPVTGRRLYYGRQRRRSLWRRRALHYRWKWRTWRAWPAHRWVFGKHRRKILNHFTQRVMKYQLAHLWFFINRWSSYVTQQLYMRTQYSLSNTCDVITFSPHSRLPQNYHNYTRAVMLNLHFLNKVIYLRSHITKFECLYPSAFKQLFHDFAFYDMTPGAESTADLERAVELARKKIYDDIKCRHSKLDFNEFAQVGIKYYWGYYFDMCDNLEFDAGTYMIPNSDRMQLQQIAILRDLLITALFRRCGMVEWTPDLVTGFVLINE